MDKLGEIRQLRDDLTSLSDKEALRMSELEEESRMFKMFLDSK
eukprot:CAMPEP_0201282848 /NCGR_PEP_ID=MMETSP1317-20130820/6866_1 /ASSEMBLY_ACC=CAM_ASM_000770 /TAXON_ID=187299 /ORGANISM="Undescribed Undescribed, Strain Undescribed" /LENGTH=42 /DNA_ID= /DNA_START= /DNA_END= /DNA_ORIENTATION=